jgi:hypothetical protein
VTTKTVTVKRMSIIDETEAIAAAIGEADGVLGALGDLAAPSVELPTPDVLREGVRDLQFAHDCASGPVDSITTDIRKALDDAEDKEEGRP